MTYGEVYKEFCDKFPNVDVEDYRPADPMYIPQLLRGIPNAIMLWLKDGSMVVYISRKRGRTMTNAEKFREVFGLPNGIEPLPYVCDILECEKVKCSDCPMYEEGVGFWNKEYKKTESEG